MTLAALSPGQSGVIQSFTDHEIAEKLLDMGFIPGEAIRVDRIAAFGCPLVVTVSGYSVSLRKSEANTIRISVSES